MAQSANQTLILWDSDSHPPLTSGSVYLWNGHSNSNDQRSVLSFCEGNAERLRKKYCKWIHDLGNSFIGDTRIIEHLGLEDGLSYWWMTLLVEKNPYKSPITDAIRLLALEEIIVQQNPDKLRLVSANQSLHETIRDLCQRLEIDYEWEKRLVEKRSSMSMRNLYRALPQPVQALISLARHVWGRWPLRRAKKPGWFDGDQSLFFCSYFFNIVPELASKGHFHSRYWEDLHRLMQNIGLHGNWLQLYIPHDAAPDPATALEWTRSFNQNREKEGSHAFLDTYLSWNIVLRVLKRWFWLNLIFWRLRQIKNVFHPQKSPLSLWPLMQSDWKASMIGPTAIHNLLWIELFDTALRDLPHQSKGFYLCENQAWERALIHAWHKHGHGQLVAVAHSTVRFWDLRYFNDPRTIRSTNMYPMPQPNLTALNGKAAVDSFLSTDYPKEAIVECEALRYGYLNDLRLMPSSRKAKEGPIRVLILGDYMPSGTIKMLRLLEAAALHIITLTTHTMKPHPNFTVKAEDYPSLKLKIVMAPLGEIMHDFDIAYASNGTSAAVDAYFFGLPVVVMLDEAELNFSPLRSQQHVRFVSTPEELAETLQKADQGIATGLEHNEFFFLDPELGRWQKLLRA